MSESISSTYSKIYANFARFAMSTGTTMLLSLALKLYMPRVLGPEKLGIFYFTESFSILFFILLSCGTQSYIVRHVPSNPAHAKEIFSTLLGFQLGFALILELCLFTGLKILGYNFETSTAALMMGLQYAAMFLQNNLVKCVFISIERYKLVARVNILSKIILVTTALLVLHLKPDIFYLTLCFFIGETTGLLILLTIAFREGLLLPNFNFSRLKNILKLSFPFLMMGIFIDIYNYIDSSLLTILTTPKEAGYYGAAMRLIGICLVFVPIIDASAGPSLSKALKENMAQYTELLRTILDFLLLASMPISLTLILFGNEICLFLYGSGFEKSTFILALLAPSLLLIYTNIFLAINLRLSTNGYRMAVGMAITTLTSIAIKSFVIPLGWKTWGEGGGGIAAAISTVGAESLTCLLFLFISPNKTLDLRSAKNCLLTIIPVIILALNFQYLSQLSLFIKVPLLILGTPAYLFMLGIISLSKIKAILNLRNQGSLPTQEKKNVA